MPAKNLGNAAFFGIKGLKKDIEDIKHRLEILENAFLQKETSNH